MKRRKLVLILMILCIIAVGCITGIKIYERYWQVSFDAVSFTESAALLDNPRCGWYNMYGYMLSDDDSSIFDTKIEKSKNDSSAFRLVLLEINLKQFADRELSANALAQLDRIFTLWSDGQHSIIVRFVYDWDGKALTSEPKELSVLQRHMQQCAQIVNAHDDTIYLLQGIFVGNHGEMNNSAYMSADTMRALALYLDGLLSPDIYMAVRTPAHLRTILQTSEPSAASDAGHPIRIGLFNDGMLGSDTDYGTYGTASDTFSSENYAAKGNRTQELAFQQETCLLVPNGGEVIVDNPYNDGDNAIEAFKTMRVSYLNHMYDQKVISKWQQQNCSQEGVFNGMSAYTYITAHLGYRYVLQEAFLTYKTFDNTASLCIVLANTGFAPSYRTFSINIMVYADGDILSDTAAPVYTADLSEVYDTAHWYPDTEYSLQFQLPVDTLGAGDYTVCLCITDKDTSEQIKLANDAVSSAYGICVGQLHITK